MKLAVNKIIQLFFFVGQKKSDCRLERKKCYQYLTELTLDFLVCIALLF